MKIQINIDEDQTVDECEEPETIEEEEDTRCYGDRIADEVEERLQDCNKKIMEATRW